MIKQAKLAFKKFFGEEPQRTHYAPGRVNLIGEHTDYNDGFVLPAAINFGTWALATKRQDRLIRALALDEHDDSGKPSFTEFLIEATIKKDPLAPWSDYLRGVVEALIARGFTLSGADILITGNVPKGAGLSSSAALENAIILALTNLSGESIDGISAAKVGQAAENHYVGCQCGIMDQMASALGEENAALLLDCRSLETKKIPLPDHHSLLVINSNVKRGLVDSEYNTRRQQCEAAAHFFKVKALRDVSLEELTDQRSLLTQEIYRRAKHVISENQRVLDTANALKNQDFARISRLMHESHESMKVDFDITVNEIDILVDIIRSSIGHEGGVRMTGGGFGGCVVALIPSSLEQQVIYTIKKEYPEKTGLQPSVFICQASDGAFSSYKTSAP